MKKISAGSQHQRWWLGGGIGLAVVLVLIGWFGLIQPQLSTAASTREQTDSTVMGNMVLEAKNSRLSVQNDNAAALRVGLAAALAELPSDGDLPEFTRQLSAQATASSVVLSSVIVGAATQVEEVVGEAAATPGSGGTATTVATPAPSAVVMQTTITVTATGLGSDILAFVQAIQQAGPRRVLVTSSQLSPAQDSAAGIGGPCTLTLTLNAFSAPLSSEDRAALEKLLNGG